MRPRGAQKLALREVRKKVIDETNKPPYTARMPKTKPRPHTLHLGANVKRFREANRLTQLTLAHKLGLYGNDAGAYICRVERGKQVPRLAMLQDIASVLGVTIKQLITLKERML